METVIKLAVALYQIKVGVCFELAVRSLQAKDLEQKTNRHFSLALLPELRIEVVVPLDHEASQIPNDRGANRRFAVERLLVSTFLQLRHDGYLIASRACDLGDSAGRQWDRFVIGHGR